VWARGRSTAENGGSRPEAVPDVVFEEQFLILVSELATGGSLHDRVASGQLQESEARLAFQQMMTAVGYCHQQNVVHRDLKLENVLLMNTEDGLFLKITGFGMSKDVEIHSLAKTRGSGRSISYMAPEMCRVSGVVSYGMPVDIWSLGCILYIMVCGQYPFGFEGTESEGGLAPIEILQRIRNARVQELPPNIAVSPELQGLFAGIFVADPDARWTLAQISQCCWYRDLTHTQAAEAAAAGAADAASTPAVAYQADMELLPEMPDGVPKVEWPAQSSDGSGSDEGLGFVDDDELEGLAFFQPS
jgi:serine/threonine protein kinase